MKLTTKFPVLAAALIVLAFLSIVSTDTGSARSVNWLSRANMPQPRAQHGVGVINGTLYAFGGGNPGLTNSVIAYDAVSDLWSSKAAMLSTRKNFMGALLN